MKQVSKLSCAYTTGVGQVPQFPTSCFRQKPSAAPHPYSQKETRVLQPCSRRHSELNNVKNTWKTALAHRINSQMKTVWNLQSQRNTQYRNLI